MFIRIEFQAAGSTLCLRPISTETSLKFKKLYNNEIVIIKKASDRVDVE